MRNRFVQLPRTVALQSIAPINAGPLENYVSEIDREVAAQGKFTKFEAGYAPFPIFPPVFWDYRCIECRQFREPNQCRWVQGDIAQDGWCSIWVPPENFERPFTWITRIRKAPGIAVRSIQNLSALVFRRGT